MTSRLPALEPRRPDLTWMLLGVLITLCLFGVLWFLERCGQFGGTAAPQPAE